MNIEEIKDKRGYREYALDTCAYCNSADYNRINGKLECNYNSSSVFEVKPDSTCNYFNK